MKKTRCKLVVLLAFSAIATTTNAAENRYVQDSQATVVATPHFRRAHEIPFVDTSLKIEQQGEVQFVTGGIGDDERAELEAMKNEFNLHVMSAAKNGAYVDEALVVISNKAGEPVLETSAGPLLYVNLPAGSYTLVATLGEQTLKQKFKVSAKNSARVHLGWNVHSTVSGDDEGTMRTY